MFQYRLVKRIERIYRWRRIYALHLALYGALLVLGVIATDPSHWHETALLLMLWLPMLMLHTAAQSLYELRERCAQPVPIPRFNVPVEVYDEDGKPIQSDKRLPG